MSEPRTTPSAGRRRPPALVERDLELRALAAALERAHAGQGQVVCVRGIAGIGKTSLLDHVVDVAGRDGWTVLQARGDELEQDFAFGVALQLLEPLLTTVDDADAKALFEGPGRLARPLLDSHGDQLPDESSLFSILHGLYWLVANLADRAPVLLLVDDGHWVDLPSLRWLHYLAKRLDEHAVALVVGTRPTAVGPSAAILAHLASDHLVEPAPLTRRGVADLVRDERPDIAADDVERWHDLTGGVPLFVRELIRAGDAVIHAEAAVDETLDTVRARLDRLSPTGRLLIEAAAIAGDGTPLWQAGRIGGVEGADATVVRELLDAALLQDEVDVAFTHPLVRDAIERSIPPRRAHELHAAAAALLADLSATPELVAHHLMACPPKGSDRNVDVLELAARRARFLGSPDHAVAWLRRALAEAPAEPARTRVLGELAVSEAAAGDEAWTTTLQRLARELTDPVERAGLWHRVGRALAFRGWLEGATAVYHEALDEAKGADLGELRLELLAGLAVASRIDVSHRTPLGEELAAALEHADVDRSPAARAILAHLAYDRALAGDDRDEVRARARVALLHPAIDDDEVLDNVASYQALLALHFADDAEPLERAIERYFDVAGRRAHETLFGLASNARGMLRLSEGRIDEALADHTAAADVMRRNRRVTLAGALGNLALSLAEQGDLDAADLALELPEGEAHWRTSASFTHWLYARGSIRLQAGDLRGLDDLREVVNRQRALGAVNPATIPAPFLLAAALAAPAPEEAAQVFEEAHVAAMRWGAPRTLAVAARTHAVLEPEAAEAHLQRAIAHVADEPWGLERMRARLALGQLLAAAGRGDEGRAPLRLVLAEADAGGAVVLATQARAALLATGARPRRTAVSGPAALTPTERSVTILARDGLTNREIAMQRFVSVKAVEYHLANAYRKLGITSRAALAAALAP